MESVLVGDSYSGPSKSRSEFKRRLFASRNYISGLGIVLRARVAGKGRLRRSDLSLWLISRSRRSGPSSSLVSHLYL